MDTANYLSSKAWPYVEARKIAERNIVDRPTVFSTGFGPSGLPHIGTFAEVARTQMVRNAYDDIMGYRRNQSRLIVFSDDMDALRAVPDNIPDQDAMQHYIGYSLTSVPDPYDMFDSFAEHNNAMLCEFLDRFEFDYEFMSSTQVYKSGAFNDALSTMWENYHKVCDIILPTLGEDRHATYSPFMPVLDNGWVISEGVRIRDDLPNMVGFPSLLPKKLDAPDSGCTIHHGRVKCQWKADWALRWYALGVDYEMAGKDLTDSVALSSRIVRQLGGRPPVSMIYELFLDEEGRKISKSKGNGITIDEWLRYGTRESLMFHLYREPQRAKKLSHKVIPSAMDEYNAAVSRMASQKETEVLSNPVHHIGEGYALNTTYQLVLNIAATAAVDDEETLMRFVLRTEEDSEPLRRLVHGAFHYYHDNMRGGIDRREATDAERVALRDLIGHLRTLPDDASEEEIQYWVYEVGKAHYSKETLRDWFRAIYEIVLGQESGPRFGAFAAMLGLTSTINLLETLSEMTITEYVDRYITGEFRENTPAEVLQFAINNAHSIEEEFLARAS